jgi:DNA-directed RNA polymerase subunit L
MGYPWYSERTGHAGENGQFKISLEKNCETKEIRFVATLIDQSKRTGRKSMSSMDITELYNKVNTYVSKMETIQDGLTEDITEVFNIYGLHNEKEAITETVENEVKPLKNSKRGYIIDPEDNEEYSITPDDLPFDNGKTEEEMINEFLNITGTESTKEIKSLKVNKQTETIIVRGYMGKVEQIEAYKIEHPELELYLYKSSKYYAIYEKKTGKTITSPKTTKKEAMDKLIETLNGYYDKLKDAITATIERDGYITDYEVGSWVRSA